MTGLAWTLKPEEATHRRSVTARLYESVLRCAWNASWNAGYKAAIRDAGDGRLRQHITAQGRVKRPFDSSLDALAFAHDKGHKGVETYECGVCGRWHLATVRS